MKIFIATVACFIFVLEWSGAATVSDARPNVLIVMPDDLSYSDYSYYNHQPNSPHTPNIDRLVGASVRLTDFHVAPTCSPSRSQLMTGRYDDACGCWHTILGRYFLRTNEVTMADVFKANGYHTAMFGKWHLGDNYPFRAKERGFEHVLLVRSGGIDQQHNPWANHNLPPCTLYDDDQPVHLISPNAAPSDTSDTNGIPVGFSTDYITTAVIRYIQARQASHERFFAYLPYNVAHGPSDLPPDARPGVSAHTGTIENMDKNVGRLLQFLDDSGLSNNTLLIFILGDNGMANFMFRGNKGTEYEAGHRVPCAIRWPAGGYAGSEVSAREIPQMTTEMDLLPTLMDVLGLHDVANRSPEVAIVGHSLKTLLDKNPANDDPVFGTRVLVVDNQRLDNLVKYKQACVMRDELDASGHIAHKWRLIRPSAAKPWELYDIQADEHEKANLLTSANNSQFTERVNTLKADYEAWWQQVSAHATEYGRCIIGASAQPIVCLYAHDWHMSEGQPPWHQSMVATGPEANGFHSVTFDHAGDYRFDLRRWPEEIADGTAVDSQLHISLRVAGQKNPTYGKALPIREARIRVWNGDKTYADERQPVKPGSSGAVFTLHLPAGPAMLQTWFYDASGHELCGAYYVYASGGQP